MSEQTSQEPEPAPPPGRSRGRRRLLIGGAAIVVLRAGAIGVAWAIEEHHHRHGMWGFGTGMPVQYLEHRADHLLHRVDATPDQQAKFHAIIEAAAGDLKPIGASVRASRAQLADLLTAPQIDRAAVEQVRAEHVAEIDQMTQRITRAAEDAADVLTPDQRTKLKQAMERFQLPEHEQNGHD